MLGGLAAVPLFGQSITRSLEDEPLRVTSSLPQGSISRFEPLTLEFNRPLESEDGRPAVFLGDVDLTALFRREGRSIRYEPELHPLPSGEADLVVYVVSPSGSWQEIGRFPVSVRLPGNFETAAFVPQLTLSNKGQIVEGRFPEPAQDPDHRIYQDFSGQLGIRGELATPAWRLQASANAVGVSYQNEALRFGELGERAPRVDLTDYLLDARRGPIGLQVGHVVHGHQRHLISGFSSRGTVLSGEWGDHVDLSIAAMNGSQIVGWKNPLGLAEPDHRMVSATAGFTMLRVPVADVRIETSYLNASVLPRTGFNQTAVVDAERSRGGAGRLHAQLLDRRVEIEAGFAGSRYVNPIDPALAQGADLVPVEQETNFARYIDASAALVRGARISPRMGADLRIAYRNERVDPLYQTAAAYVRPDILQHAFEVQGSLGPLSVRVAHLRSEDNLDDITSILKTKTRQGSLNVGLMPASLLGIGASQAVRALVPMVSYVYDRTHQYGAGLPENGGFSPTHVPDQVNHLHNAGIDWQGMWWSLGYRFASSEQDNRQEGREDADFLDQTHGMSLAVRATRFLELGVDLDFNRAVNLADEETDWTRRLGAHARFRPVERLNLSVSYAPTRVLNNLRTRRRFDSSFRAEGAYAFSFAGVDRMPVRGQVFIRYARQAASNRDHTYGLDSETRFWSVNTGFSLSFF